jgi:hypothetical protein
METFGAEAAVIHAIVSAASNADHAPVLDADIDGAAVRAQQAGRLNPVIRFVNQMFVDSHRPDPVYSGCAFTPDVLNAVATGLPDFMYGAGHGIS